MSKYPRIAGKTYEGQVLSKPNVWEKPKEEMVKGYGGGYAFKTKLFDQVRRWLILGSDSNTYYATPQELTRANVPFALKALKENPRRYIDLIVEVRQKGLSPKRDTCIFAYALAFTDGSIAAKAHARNNVSKVLRTGDDIANFVSMIAGEKVDGKRRNYMRGWGRAFRTTTAKWYEERDLQNLVYQLIKYRNRHGWSQGNVIKLSHPNPGVDSLRSKVFKWATGGEFAASWLGTESPVAQIYAFEEAKTTVTDGNDPIVAKRPKLIQLVTDYRLPWEAIPNAWMNDPVVLEALLQDMPMGAMVRQLPRFTWSGMLNSLAAKEIVLDRLSSEEYVLGSQIHPLKLLQAMLTYKQGHGERSSWTPVTQVVDALEYAFYLAFPNVKPSGKNLMLAVDMSGSMGLGSCAGMAGVSPRMGAAAMAMITMKTEPWYYLVGFMGNLVELRINENMSLWEVANAISTYGFGATNVGAPMKYAADKKLPVDMFVVYTDYELNRGLHPVSALVMHQEATGRNSKIAYVAMQSYPHTCADPTRNDMMDFVGFDPTTPEMLTRFAVGDI
jgi:60 kDa SS-A/Ro ribonucleoprotein